MTETEVKVRKLQRFLADGAQVFMNLKSTALDMVGSGQTNVPNTVWAVIYGLGYRKAYDDQNVVYDLPALSEKYAFVPYHVTAWKDGLRDGLEDKLNGYPPAAPTETFLARR